MSGDEEQNAGSDHDGAEADGEDDRPAHSAGIVAGFEITNAVGCWRVNDARRDPLLQLLFELFGGGHSYRAP
jgi:hypothetical protein